MRVCASVVVAAVLAATLTGCVPGVDEQRTFLERAATLSAPAGFDAVDAPTAVCPEIGSSCPTADVIATWYPAGADPSAEELCDAFLPWAADLGVARLFIGDEFRWLEWYSADAHARVISGGTPTVAIDDPEARPTCVDAVTATLEAPVGAGLRTKLEVIGITGVPGVSGGLLLTRLMPPRAVPDGSTIESPDPYMIAAVYVLR